MTVTVIGMWEPGFSESEQIIEWRMWKQTVEAFAVDRWVMVRTADNPHPSAGTFERYAKIRGALNSLDESLPRVFLTPRGGIPLKDFVSPRDVVYVFGNASFDPAVQLMRPQDLRVTIPTPQPIDMFAACVLPYVLSRT